MDGLSITNRSTDSLVKSSQNTEFKKITNENKEIDGGFVNTLKEAVQKVNTVQKEADAAMQDLATGRSNNIHETMIKAEKADMALKLMVQVRNKIIDAYREVMKMQV